MSVCQYASTLVRMREPSDAGNTTRSYCRRHPPYMRGVYRICCVQLAFHVIQWNTPNNFSRSLNSGSRGFPRLPLRCGLRSAGVLFLKYGGTLFPPPSLPRAVAGYSQSDPTISFSSTYIETHRSHCRTPFIIAPIFLLSLFSYIVESS